MKIQIASDLHLERHFGCYPPARDFLAVKDRDVLVLAGDIGTHTGAMEFVLEQAEISPVIYVPGNHEYYSRHTRHETDYAWRQIAAETPALHYLVAESVSIDGVRFWGAPWYSNFHGRRDHGYLRVIRSSINDFSFPYHNDHNSWTVISHLEEHERQTALLREQAGKVDVVVTHWPPTRHATAPRFLNSLINPYFVNHLEELVKEIAAPLWISGHVHDPFDAVVGPTRCVGNPCGYPGETPETGGYSPEFAVGLPVLAESTQ